MSVLLMFNSNGEGERTSVSTWMSHSWTSGREGVPADTCRFLSPRMKAPGSLGPDVCIFEMMHLRAGKLLTCELGMCVTASAPGVTLPTPEPRTAVLTFLKTTWAF